MTEWIEHDGGPQPVGFGGWAMSDTRPLSERVKALANRFDAMAIGAEKMRRSLQDVGNYRRDARTLHDAADKLKEVGR